MTIWNNWKQTTRAHTSSMISTHRLRFLHRILFLSPPPFLSLCIQILVITILCHIQTIEDQAFDGLNDIKLPPSRGSTSWRQFSMALCERLTASRINSIVKCRGRSTQKRQKDNWEVVTGSEGIIDRATRLLYPLRPEADGNVVWSFVCSPSTHAIFAFPLRYRSFLSLRVGRSRFAFAFLLFAVHHSIIPFHHSTEINDWWSMRSRTRGILSFFFLSGFLSPKNNLFHRQLHVLV